MGSERKTTSQTIMDLVNPEPVSFDPEEEEANTETAARVVDRFDEGFSDDENVSQFRKKVHLLEDDDARYTGKRVSRKSLGVSKEELQDSDEDVDDDDEEDEEHSAAEETDLSDGEDEGESGRETFSEGSDSESWKGGDDEQTSGNVEENENFQHIRPDTSASEVDKGNCVRNQLKLWDNLLECRIQLQKCLITVNKFPQHNIFEEFKRQGGSEFQKSLNQTNDNVQNLLEKLVDLKDKLFKSFPETKSMCRTKRKKESIADGDMDDEEIPSSSDESEVSEEEDVVEKSSSKRRKIDDYSELLHCQHQEYKDYRDSVIQKWNDKTRVSSGKVSSKNFSGFEQSTLKQIEQILLNRPRLIQRTQLKRSVYNILGKSPDATVEKPDANSVPQNAEENVKEYDAEIFDDSDFYHQLLRELIEKKAADVTDPIQLGKQWVELQKLRSKMKRKIDVKATKGRRIRYVVHPKLVNFMAPIPQSTWTDAAKSDLYSSLFGKIKC